ncbi:hypothetical protein [Streptomyces roseicoloratus]|uniref:Uncharacterized protein n=1 Tax=Streptomyces roseicoloratus TaxID=2508722 RepID=A0ABY9S1M3_9ACTN|nr:hypothetical protein [Streptomyces roseicoloratus]WMX48324.1 hypothetical protein RGF97_30915 [Streptomyces roseicoloratus]
MRDNDTSGRPDTGLSTEDIARRPAGNERGTDPAAPPAYPGESIPTSGDDSPGGTGERGGPGDPGGTDTGTGVRTDRTGDAVTETGTGTFPDTDTGAETGTVSDADSDAYSRTGTDAGADSRTGTDTGVTEADGGVRADRPDRTVDGSPRLMEAADEESFRTRWHDIQSMFVDDPREAVHAADTLVADVMQKLAATFADHRRTLEGQWKQGEDVDTEALRTALRQYRSFFQRLLSQGADHDRGSDRGPAS